MYKFHLPAWICGLLIASVTMTVWADRDYDSLPDLGDASGQVLSPQHDRALGTEFMRQIRQAGMVLDDPEVTRYLRHLARKLVAHSESPGHDFTFFVVNDARINAFAGPGGYIGANIGLFTAADSESELAGVMAHEIAHVTQRHLARAFESRKKLSVVNTAAILAAILIGTQDGSAGIAALTAASALGIQQQINFTRANEKEADRVGIRSMAGAGYDPHGMADFFEKLQKNAKLYGTRPPEFLSTHPVTTNRIAEATSRAESYPPVEPRDQTRFLLMRAKLRVASYESPRQVLADHQRYHDKTGGQTAAERYEYALLLATSTQYKEATAVMLKLHRADPDELAYRLALARILRQAGQLKAALKLYKDGLELYPGEYALVLPYANTLMAAGGAEQAYTLLVDISSHHPDNPSLYKLLAQAAGKTNRSLQTHTAMANYYYLSGYTKQAVEQLKLAKRSPRLSNYQAARINALLEAYEQVLAESALE